MRARAGGARPDPRRCGVHRVTSGDMRVDDWGVCLVSARAVKILHFLGCNILTRWGARCWGFRHWMALVSMVLKILECSSAELDCLTRWVMWELLYPMHNMK